MTVAVRGTRTESGLSLEVAAATLLVLVLAVAAGNRWFGFGRDYLFYTEFYDRLGIATRLTEERFEPGFTAGAWLFKYGLGLPYAAYATVLVGGALAVKFALFFRHCDKPLLACLVYCAAFYPLHEYTQIRVAVALAFGMAGAVTAVKGRPILGGLLVLAGVTFQSTEIVVGIGIAITMLLRLRLTVALLLCGMLVVVVQGLMPSDPVAFLASLNPLAQDYINQLDADVPNFFSVANMTTIIVVLGIAPIVLLERERTAQMPFVMGLLSIITFLVLRGIPTFAHRFREMFAIFVILLAFMGRRTAMRQGLQIVMTVAGFWLLSQYIVDGLVG